MLLNTNKWHVRAFVQILKVVPARFVSFRLENARVGNDTRTWLRVVTKNTLHKMSVTVSDSVPNNVVMAGLPNHWAVTCWVEYDENYTLGKQRLWCITGTESDLQSVLEVIQDVLAAQVTPQGIHVST